MPLSAPDAELLDQLARIYMLAAVEALARADPEDFADANDSNVVPSPDDKDAALAGG